MTNRRSVLQLLGLAPLAAPLAAKIAADKAVGDLAGIGLPLVEAPFVRVTAPPSQVCGGSDWKAKILRFLLNQKLPEWLESDLRDRYWQVGHLDPDIACKRSWSMSVKIMTQRQRNIERARREAFEGPRRSLRRHEFEEKYGVWL